jgi:hypothetical protein
MKQSWFKKKINKGWLWLRLKQQVAVSHVIQNHPDSEKKITPFQIHGSLPQTSSAK